MMWSTLTRLCCISLLVLLSGSEIFAQDYRVLTTIRNLTPRQARQRQSPIIGRNLTIFHAGEAYDRVEDVKEVTIWQPSRHQYTIFSESRMLATTISFQKINQIQRDMDRQTQGWIRFLRKKGDDASLREAGTLQFQLLPHFQERFDNQKKILRMGSDQYSYTVQSIPLDKPEIVKGYLDYADWMARLNPLLHSQAMFPAPRLKVNESLRARGLMPLTVSRKRNIAGNPHLQARHEIIWKLTKRDKSSILAWKRKLQSEEMKWVEFVEFQAAVMPPREKSITANR